MTAAMLDGKIDLRAERITTYPMPKQRMADRRYGCLAARSIRVGRQEEG